MALTVVKSERHGWAVLQVMGEMDVFTSPAVRDGVHEAVAAGRRRMVLDLSQVRFCDSSGIGVLIASRRLMRSCQGEVRLVMPEEGTHVNRVFGVLGVRRLFDISPDLASALEDGTRSLDMPA